MNPTGENVVVNLAVVSVSPRDANGKISRKEAHFDHSNALIFENELPVPLIQRMNRMQNVLENSK